jgi:hypothetical protein
MKSKFFLAALAAFVAAFTLQPQQANATIWRVNNNPVYIAGDTPGTLCDHCFDNLQTAVDDVFNVQNGDTIHVEASPTPYTGKGAYGEVVIIRRLVLLGPGYFLDYNPGLQHNPIAATITNIRLDIGSKGTILKGLRIAEDFYSFIYINDDNVTVERCYVEDNIDFINTTPRVLNNVSIKQCYVAGILGDPTYPGPINNLVVMNNYFGSVAKLANNYQGVFAHNVTNNGVNGYGGMVYYNNIIKSGTFTQNNNSVTNVYKNIFYNKPAWLDVPSPTNFFNVVIANVFATTGSIDGRLDPLPTCTDCPNGANGHEIGMFGGPDPYRLGGVPDIPAIVDLQKDVNVVQGGALPITIKTRTNN